MSEYQYYEFLALDRPLTDEQRAELRKLSSRADITATRFVNEYSYGDFRGSPEPQSTGQYRVTGGAPTRKVLLDQERWELSKLQAPGLKEHLSDAIVACSGEDARIVR